MASSGLAASKGKRVGLLGELKRRNVIRMAGLYLVGGWLVLQVADILLPAFGAPDWVLRALVLVLALGLLATLVVSWVYELTPEGLKREREVDPAHSTAPQTGRRLEVAILVLLLCVGALALWNGLRPDAPATVVTAAEPAAAAPLAAKAAPINDKSIAVLPFADFSQDGDQAWFADGLAEEILNALAKTPDLKVSARTSSFQYKDSDLGIPQIAAELGVAHVLEGSVRSGGDRIRVTAQLIRASDGFHVWSQTYDRDASDVISIQEDLAREIATAMQTTMDPVALADMAKVGTTSVEAYQEYLRGVALSVRPDPQSVEQAYQHFERARTLAPTFATAHARAANYWISMLDSTRTTSSVVGLSTEEIRANARERLDLAVQHAQRDVDRYASLALRAQFDLRYKEAIEWHRKVLVERPMDVTAMGALLDLLTRTGTREDLREPLEQIWPLAFERWAWTNLHLNYAHRGPDRQRAADQALKLLERWPDDEFVMYQAHRALLWAGRTEAARRVLERWRQSAVSLLWVSIPPARQASAEGDCDEVRRLLDTVPADDVPQRWHLLMMLGEHAQAEQVLRALERSGNVQGLAGFLSYRQFDPTPFPSLMQALERDGIQRPPAEPLPFACQAATPETPAA